VITGVGILIGVAYTLRAIQKAFFGDVAADVSPRHSEEKSAALSRAQPHENEPITVPERLGAVLLIGASLLVGLYPRILLDVIVPSFNSPLFDGLRRVGLQ
jgi:NADH-quinone oxidoreductase subunit M